MGYCGVGGDGTSTSANEARMGLLIVVMDNAVDVADAREEVLMRCCVMRAMGAVVVVEVEVEVVMGTVVMMLSFVVLAAA